MHAVLVDPWMDGLSGYHIRKFLRKGNTQDLILYGGVSPMKKNVNCAEQEGCSNFKLQQELERKAICF